MSATQHATARTPKKTGLRTMTCAAEVLELSLPKSVRLVWYSLQAALWACLRSWQ